MDREHSPFLLLLLPAHAALLFSLAARVHTHGMSFQDHFSTQADSYARFRPTYPRALYEWLAAQVASHTLAWDCGTGNGQAAVALTDYFARVIASDPSAAQIRQARPHARVQYVVASAEQPPEAVRGADLVTAAQALHWFDATRFYPALARVLTPEGLFAAWGYGHLHITPEVDAAIGDYYTNIVGPYWPEDRRHVETHYRELPFPLVELEPPAFSMSATWSLQDCFGYLDSWSATRRCLQAQGQHPLARIAPALTEAWGSAPTRAVTWPLFVRAGRLG